MANQTPMKPWDPWEEVERKASNPEPEPMKEAPPREGGFVQSEELRDIPREEAQPLQSKPAADLGKSYFPPQPSEVLEKEPSPFIAPSIENERDYFAPPKEAPKTSWMEKLPPVSPRHEGEIPPLHGTAGASPKAPFEPVTGTALGVKMKGKGLKLSRKSSIIKEILKFFGIFVAVFAIIFVILNWPSIAVNLKYWWEQNRSGDQSTAEDIDLGVESPENIPQDDRIVIKKIKVDAPIMFPKDPSDKVLLEELKRGVVHYPGTALPGETGNCFITGHSSNYWWIKSKYNTVFTLLPKLVVGDKVIVYYKQKKYIYEVREVKEVSPSQTEVLNPTEKPTLTLMTCVPIGTNLRRLIVRCDQISPASGENVDLNQPRLPAD